MVARTRRRYPTESRFRRGRLERSIGLPGSHIGRRGISLLRPGRRARLERTVERSRLADGTVDLKAGLAGAFGPALSLHFLELSLGGAASRPRATALGTVRCILHLLSWRPATAVFSQFAFPFRLPTGCSLESHAALECKVAPMSTDPNKETSGTLMMRIQEDPADRGAWDEFVEIYQPMIRDWCLRWGSQPADAEDVAQQVLLKLLTAMKNYRRRAGSGFRGWLKTVTHNAWLDFVTSRHQLGPVSGVNRL